MHKTLMLRPYIIGVEEWRTRNFEKNFTSRMTFFQICLFDCFFFLYHFLQITIIEKGDI